MMDILAYIVRILHVGFALLVAGGVFVQLLAVRPALAALDEPQRVAARNRVADRWRPWVLTAVIVLLVTGLMNFLMFRVPAYRGHANVAVYHALFGLKLLLALGVFHISIVLVLPGEKFDAKYRANAGLWLGLAAALIVAIILVAGFMYSFPRFFPGA